MVAINPAFPDIPSFFIIPRMAPLSPGHHAYELIWVLSAPHCDGLSADEDVSCLPAGGFSPLCDPRTSRSPRVLPLADPAGD